MMTDYAQRTTPFTISRRLNRRLPMSETTSKTIKVSEAKQRREVDDSVGLLLCLAMAVIGIGYAWLLFGPSNQSQTVTVITLAVGLGLGAIGVFHACTSRKGDGKEWKRNERGSPVPGVEKRQVEKEQAE